MPAGPMPGLEVVMADSTLLAYSASHFHYEGLGAHQCTIYYARGEFGSRVR